MACPQATLALRMRLLHRYLARELLMPLGVCLGGFLIFWVGFDILGNLSEYREKSLTIQDVGELYLVMMPELLTTVLPLALLLALLYAVTRHAKHQELTAIRAAGVGWWWISLPYLSVGLAGVGLLFVLNEIVYPDAPDRAEMIKQRHTETPTARVWRTRVGFRNEMAGRAWHIGAFNLVHGAMQHPSFREFLPTNAFRKVEAGSVEWTNGFWRGERFVETLYRDPSDGEPAAVRRAWARMTDFGEKPELVGTLRSAESGVVSNVLWFTNVVHGDWRAGALAPTNLLFEGLTIRLPLGARAERIIQAESAVWTNSQWQFIGVTEHLYRFGGDDDPIMVTNAVRTFPGLGESPAHIRSELKMSGRNAMKVMRRARLSLAEIDAYRRLHPNLAPRDAQFLETQWHARIAGPWTCFVVTLIAIPFGAPSGRRNIFFGVAGSISLAFAYFVLQRIGFAMAQGGAAPAWVGAWMPNAVFLVTGIIMMARNR